MVPSIAFEGVRTISLNGTRKLFVSTYVLLEAGSFISSLVVIIRICYYGSPALIRQVSVACPRLSRKLWCTVDYVKKFIRAKG